MKEGARRKNHRPGGFQIGGDERDGERQIGHPGTPGDFRDQRVQPFPLRQTLDPHTPADEGAHKGSVVVIDQFLVDQREQLDHVFRAVTISVKGSDDGSRTRSRDITDGDVRFFQTV